MKKCEVFVRSAEFTGPCLSCTTPAAEGMTVEIIPEVRFSFADRSDGYIWPPTPGQSGYAIACDIGTKDGRTVFFLTENKRVFLSQADISKFQLAKAAISAGIRILAQENGVPLSGLDKLLLGGGFGFFAHRRNSALLGIIPQECKGKDGKAGQRGPGRSHLRRLVRGRPKGALPDTEAGAGHRPAHPSVLQRRLYGRHGI